MQHYTIHSYFQSLQHTLRLAGLANLDKQAGSSCAAQEQRPRKMKNPMAVVRLLSEHDDFMESATAWETFHADLHALAGRLSFDHTYSLVL